MDMTTDPPGEQPIDPSLLRRLARTGNQSDHGLAASLVDRVLAVSCPHDPERYHLGVDMRNGRPLVSCLDCGVTWYADFTRRLARAHAARMTRGDTR